jgi:hypothetical protein
MKRNLENSVGRRCPKPSATFRQTPLALSRSGAAKRSSSRTPTFLARACTRTRNSFASCHTTSSSRRFAIVRETEHASCQLRWMAVGFVGSKVRGFKGSGFRGSGFVEPRSRVVSACRFRRTPEPKNPRTQEPKNPRTQEPKNPRTQEPKNPRTQEPKNPRTQEPSPLFYQPSDGFVDERPSLGSQ